MDIIEFLPEQWRPIAEVVAKVIVQLAIISAILKPVIIKYLGEPSANDGGGKKFVFWLLRGLDWLSLNSEPVARRQQRVAAKRTLDSIQSVPPHAMEDDK